MKELLRLLKPLKRKIILNNLLYRVLQMLSIGMAAVFFILLFSKFVYVPQKTVICIAIVAVSVIAGFVLALAKYKVTDYNAAEEGDRLGCDERLITAYEILASNERENVIDKLAVKDAIATAGGAKLADKYKIKFPKKFAVITAITLAASCLTGFAPNAGVYKPSLITEQALKDAEAIKKSVNGDEQLSENFKDEYNKILKDLNKNLKKAKDAKDAQKMINDAQKELKKLENKANKDKNSIKNSLSDFAAGNDISNAMDLNDSEALSKAMEKLAEELKNLSDEDLQKLAELLAEQAENLSDEELKELIKEAAEAAEHGDTEKLAQALSQAASQSLSKSSAASSTASRTASSLAKASDGTGKSATSTPNSSGNSTSDEKGSGSCDGKDSCDGNGSGSGNGNGNGNGNGSGNGNGTGSGGTGTGTGGNGRGFGHAEPEKVYTRNAEGMEGVDEQLLSQQTDEGEVTYSQTKADGVNGQSVPYDTVVKDYKEQALKETENGNISYGMKEVIAEYFSSLEK